MEVERDCMPVLHLCLRRHGQRAGNIKMQASEVDRDREREREAATLMILSGKTRLQGRRQNNNTSL